MNVIYSLTCFYSDSNDILNKFSYFQYLYINSKDTVNSHWEFVNIWIKITSEILQFLPSFNLGNSIPALKLTQICCIKFMNVSFLENWQFNHKLAPPFLHTYQTQKIVLIIRQNIKVSKIQKYQFSNSLVNWEKFGSTA